MFLAWARRACDDAGAPPIAVGVAALASAVGLSGCVLNACPAIGYLDTAPVELAITSSLPSASMVSACFESGCTPATVSADDDGIYRGPQRAPVLDSGTVQPTTIRVVVEAADAVLTDAVHTIPTRAERTGLWGQCPGPWSYQPVEIRW